MDRGLTRAVPAWEVSSSIRCLYPAGLTVTQYLCLGMSGYCNVLALRDPGYHWLVRMGTAYVLGWVGFCQYLALALWFLEGGVSISGLQRRDWGEREGEGTLSSSEIFQIFQMQRDSVKTLTVVVPQSYHLEVPGGCLGFCLLERTGILFLCKAAGFHICQPHWCPVGVV